MNWQKKYDNLIALAERTTFEHEAAAARSKARYIEGKYLNGKNIHRGSAKIHMNMHFGGMAQAAAETRASINIFQEALNRMRDQMDRSASNTFSQNGLSGPP